MGHWTGRTKIVKNLLGHLLRVNGSGVKKGPHWVQMGRFSLSPRMAARDDQITSHPNSYLPSQAAGLFCSLFLGQGLGC